MRETDCTRVNDQDLLARYIGRRLSESEAEAFESHYFGCERCWEEVHAAAEVRLTKRVGVFARASPRTALARRDPWTLLAAAAAVAVMVFGLQQLAQRRETLPTAPTWRSPASNMFALEVSAGTSGQLRLRWPAHPEARTYAVEVFASDGESLWQGETAETTMSLDAGAFQPSSKVPSFATVEALDSMRQVVARSKRTKLP